MKKLLLLTASVFLLGACNWGDDVEIDETADGYELQAYAFIQHEVAMDPYRIAERLNVLLTECNWNLESADTYTRAAIFGGTDITHAGSGVYLLTFSSYVADNDDMREGSVIINTGGKLLSEPGANWTVSTPTEDGYSLGRGSYIYKVYPGTYTINCSTLNKWGISVSGLVSETTGSSALGVKSEWNTGIVIEQNEGDQSYSSWRSATYLVTVTVDGARSMFSNYSMGISTATPLKYNPRVCGRNIIGDGAANCWLSDNMESTYTKVTWMGTSLTSCNPKIKIWYKGHENEY